LPSGLVATKRLQVQQTSYWTKQHGVGQTNPQVINFDAAYTYDTGGEGKILSVSYPSTTAGAGPKYTYSFDSMYRLAGMTDQNNNTDVSGVAYNAANQLTAITYFGTNEQRSDNTLNQLTNIAAYTTPGNWIINKGYTYPSGTNIGKISSQTDGISGEVVQYTYDSLNRLLSASATSPTAWGQTFSYDPFGNLTAKTATGAAPTIPTSAEPSSYDANGNVTATYGSQYIYDGQNRMVEYNDTINNGATLAHFGYDPQNRRVWQWNGSLYAPYNVNPAAYTVYFYGVDGKRLASYTLTANVTWQGNQVSSVYMASAVAQQDAYFGSRRLAPMDRVGSTASPSESFYPYGEDKGTPQANDSWKFATYWRDSATGLDYAVNRYYSSGLGRFLSPDPAAGSARSSNPQSMNRYAYSGNDPVNRGDPSGLCYLGNDGITNAAWNDSAFASFNSDAVAVFPYSSGAGQWWGIPAGVLQTALQALGPKSSTFAAIEGLLAAAAQGGPIDVITFSGGAGGLQLL
jgi:RHS repeat-associated protein